MASATIDQQLADGVRAGAARGGSRLGDEPRGQAIAASPIGTLIQKIAPPADGIDEQRRRRPARAPG